MSVSDTTITSIKRAKNILKFFMSKKWDFVSHGI